MTTLKHAVVTASPLRNHGHTNTVKFEWMRLCDVSDEESPATELAAMTLQVHVSSIYSSRAARQMFKTRKPP
jgi:hypothetical protein